MKKLVAFVFSDLHIHNWKNHNEGGKRLKAHLDFLTYIWKLSLEANVPILFGGDLIHDGEKVSMALLDSLVDTLDKLNELKTAYEEILDKPSKTKILAIHGNHYQDTYNKYNSPAKNIVTILSKTHPNVIKDISNNVVLLSKGIRVWGIPYFRFNDGLSETLADFKKLGSGREDKVNILMLHTILPGVQDTNGMIIKEEGKPLEDLHDLFADYSLVLCGHIHKQQHLGGNIYSIGSPLQQRLTDKNSVMGYYALYDDLSMVFLPYSQGPVFEYYKGTEKPEGRNFYIQEDEVSSKVTTQIHIPKRIGKSLKSVVKSYMEYAKVNNRVRRKVLLTVLEEVTNND